MHNIAVAVLCFTLLKKMTAENVALGKTTRYCDKRYLSAFITDGERTTHEVQSTPCDINAFLVVDLVKDYYVHYVIVFLGRGYYTSNLMDHFIVKELVNGSYIKCSEYPATSVQRSSMMLNCKPLGATNKVRFDSRKNEGIVIAEIEIHALGINNNDILVYRGCFDVFRGVTRRDTGIYECQRLCQAMYTYFAMRDDSTCLCGNKLETRHEVSWQNCYNPCNLANFEGRCGGTTALSVFIANAQLPYYLGCYDVDPRHVMPFEGEHTNSIPECIEFCQDKRYLMITGGGACHCSSTEPFTTFNLSHVLCDMPCPGDTNTFCGGSTGYSVYRTCHPLKCSDLFHCADAWDECGVCTTNCQPGFTGLHCLDRVLQNNGCWLPNVCRNLSNSVCINTNDSYICDCRTGYILQDDTCKDRVCHHYNPCVNQSNTRCNNKNDEIWCECIDGYSKSFSGVCEDINECDHTPCDVRYSTCVNNNGSFECICKFGYLKLSPELCLENESTREELPGEESSLAGHLKIMAVVIIAMIIIFSIYRNLKITKFGSNIFRRSSIVASSHQSAISF